MSAPLMHHSFRPRFLYTSLMPPLQSRENILSGPRNSFTVFRNLSWMCQSSTSYKMPIEFSKRNVSPLRYERCWKRRSSTRASYTPSLPPRAHKTCALCEMVLLVRQLVLLKTLSGYLERLDPNYLLLFSFLALLAMGWRCGILNHTLTFQMVFRLSQLLHWRRPSRSCSDTVTSPTGLGSHYP